MGSGLTFGAPYLRCPFCAESLAIEARAVRCVNGHSFDIARQGYVSLLAGDASSSTADSADMVAARERFLGGGHYDAIADAIDRAIPREVSGLCVDVGGGTGFYLARVLDRHPDLIGIDLDLSKLALRRAARAHSRLAAIVADAWKPMPIRNDAAAYVLSVFSPRNPAEITRMLQPTGRLVVVTPTSRHLAELVNALDLVTVDDRKQERLDKQLGDFGRLSSAQVEYEVTLRRDDVLDAILMGPSARHVTAHELADRVDAAGTPLSVTVSVNVDTYAPGRVTEARGKIEA